MKKLILPLLVLVISLIDIRCSIFQTISNISRLKFKLADVNNFTISGVPISGKTRLQDFTATELLAVSSSFAQGKLPVSFTLNVEAKNPNDGTGGYPQTNATIQSFPWRLEIDDKETISGNIGTPVTVPGTGELTTIPMQMNLDLLSFFEDKGYESLLNLALNIGGVKKTEQNLALLAQPTVRTSLGDITYPGELKIVGYEFTE